MGKKCSALQVMLYQAKESRELEVARLFDITMASNETKGERERESKDANENLRGGQFSCRIWLRETTFLLLLELIRIGRHA